MKSRLQKKEIFVPLAGGAHTETDPRLGQSPTIIAENVDFNVGGVARKRDGLATFYGTNDAAPSSFTEERYMTPTPSNTIVVFGHDAFESVGSGNFVQIAAIASGSFGVIGLSERTMYHATENRDYGYTGDSIWVNSAGSEPVQVIAMSGNTGVSGGVGTNVLVAVGERSGVVKEDAGGTAARASIPINSIGLEMTGTVNCAFISANATNYTVTRWDGANSNFVSATAAFTGGKGGFTSIPMSAKWIGGNVALVATYANTTHPIIATVNIVSGAEMDTEAVNTFTKLGGSCIFGTCANASVHAIAFAGAKNANANVGVEIVTCSVNVSTGAITLLGNAVVNIEGSLTNAVVQAITGSSANATCSVVHTCYYEFNLGRFRTERTRMEILANGVVNATSGGSTKTIGPALVGQALTLTELDSTDIEQYVCFASYGGRLYLTAPPAADKASPQNKIVLCRRSGFGPGYFPVGTLSSHVISRIHINPGACSLWRNSSSNATEITFPIPQSTTILPTSNSNSVAHFGLGSTSLVKYRLDFGSNVRIAPVIYGDYVMVPGLQPMCYDGAAFFPMGVPEYPEGVTATRAGAGTGAFTNAGGNGTYNYVVTFKLVDSLGREHVSAPSPAANATTSALTDTITVNFCTPAFTSQFAYAGNTTAKWDLYRTSADLNDYYLIASGDVNYENSWVSYVDMGGVGFTANTGIDTLLNAKPLYTMAGELENTPADPHWVAEVHSGRYCYATKDEIRYSKSLRSGVAPEFNEVLSIPVFPVGGDVKALRSYAEKLYIGKQSAWMVTYGEPLNDAGMGSGFAPPRVITQQAGVSHPTAVASGVAGIFFINSLDGLIYRIQEESVVPIGNEVRYYCETYTYDNAWYAPQDSCVRFSSATVGAPTLSYNYKYGLWSTFTGRYDDGIRCAFSAPVGPSNAMVDVVMDVNGKVYVQDPTGTNATSESFNVNISTSWIPLGDILGYGKFYKWTLLGGKKNSALNLVARTAYDMEPYWTDSQNFSANSLTAFADSTQYGAMTSCSVVDQALKLDIDGSRHKTDAIRLCISENNGTARDSIEILGARLEVGVRPGSTRLGGGRTVS